MEALLCIFIGILIGFVFSQVKIKKWFGEIKPKQFVRYYPEDKEFLRDAWFSIPPFKNKGK